MDIAAATLPTYDSILYYGSDYFKTLLSGDWKETRGDKSAEAAAPGSVSVFIRATIDLFDESPQTFLQVLNHLYPKLSLKLSEANWQDVWRLADKLDLADLVALCEKYMGDKVLHVDPLTVLAWARRNTRKEWYRKSSEVVLDRVASGQIADLSAMPVSLQLAVSLQRQEVVWLDPQADGAFLQLMTKRFHMLRNIFSFADQVRQIMDLLPQSALFEWDQVAKEAAAKPSRAAAVRLLQAATGLNTRYPYSRAPTSSQTLSKLIERFRPVSAPCLVTLTRGSASHKGND